MGRRRRASWTPLRDGKMLSSLARRHFLQNYKYKVVNPLAHINPRWDTYPARNGFFLPFPCRICSSFAADGTNPNSHPSRTNRPIHQSAENFSLMWMKSRARNTKGQGQIVKFKFYLQRSLDFRWRDSRRMARRRMRHLRERQKRPV